MERPVPTPAIALLLADIATFCATHGVSESWLGQKALGDKHFVEQVRAGRDVKSLTELKMRLFMRDHQAAA